MSNQTLKDLINSLAKVPFSEISAEVPAFMTKAYELGRQTERAQVVDAAAQIADALRSLNIDINTDQTQPSKAAGLAQEGVAASPERDYGEVTRMVRHIVDGWLDPDGAFGAADIAVGLRSVFPDESIDSKQVHNAIKGLHKQGHIRRISRGLYMREATTTPTEKPDPKPESGPTTADQGGLPMQQDGTT